MSNWNADRADAADRAIDRAVREIMSAEPRPGFRYRVFARLDERPRFASTWTRVALSAVGALAIILAIVVARQGTRGPESPRVADGQPATITAPPAIPSPGSTEPRRTPERAVARSVPSSPRIDREPMRSEPRLVRAASLSPDMPATEVGGDRSGIESSVVIEPITISPLVSPQVTLRPLPTLERISISPLSTPR
jgi:hypothetical protein